MRKRSVLWLVPLCLLFALAALSEGCSSNDSGGSLSLEEYFQEVDALDQESADKTSAFDSRFDTAETADEARDLVAELIAVFEEFRDGLRDLEPPGEVADAHEKSIEGFNVFVEEVQSVLDSASSAGTVEDLFAELEAIGTTGVDQATEACTELEQIAIGNSIEVDFDCAS